MRSIVSIVTHVSLTNSTKRNIIEIYNIGEACIVRKLYLVLVMVLVFCIPLAAMADTGSDWNAKCKYKTRSTATVYSLSSEEYQEEHGGYVYTYYRNVFTPSGTIPGDIYVMPLSPRTDDKYEVSYWDGSSFRNVWMDSSNLTSFFHHTFKV